MAGFDYPDGSPVVDSEMMLTTPWRSVFSRWHSIILSAQESGTTAQRPVQRLYIGRRYFDVTLGKPIYLKSINPSVWVDGVGVVS